MTVATACQSPASTATLLASGLPARLSTAVLEFCLTQQGSQVLTDADKATNHHNGLTLNANHVGTILKFFTSLCSTTIMKDWLGTPEGSVFWVPLLRYLDQKTSEGTGFGYSWELSSVIPQLEALTTKLLSQATSVHPGNQTLLARVLSDLITQHTQTQMSGFTRRLVLQLLLESEKILVCIDRPAVSTAGEVSSALPHPHPSFGIGHKQHLLHLPTDTSISDILLCNLSTSSDIPSMVKNSFKQGKEQSKERDPQLWEIQETLSATLTAGNTAKDKRLKDSKNAAVKPLKKRSLSTAGDSSVLSFSQLVWTVRHEQIPDELPHGLTLSQLLYLYPPSTPHLKLSITPPSGSQSSGDNEEKNASLLNTPHLQTPLLFGSDQKLDMEDINDMTEAEGSGGTCKNKKSTDPPSSAGMGATVPPHSLAAFGLFLRLPGYADVLLKDKKKAMYLLRLVLGVTDDGEGDINDMTEAEGSGGTCKNKKSTDPPSSAGMGATVPPHSLAAFGLFLRLPGYADVLLKDKKKAMYLLRLVLGVTDDGEGGTISFVRNNTG
ncbi:baculoviral IAP repeat-containing protein 6-like [Diaphorina citri]|uniref:Baculoviral IAP repeat-containing protein 6-like n=1 Tax=Diaphorina citri TaxID=121845 RepID=A0A3Q0JKA4_DIACI|nr:baculoviral IAP repeat-containing protein 6-like [Diaphorina citri]